MTLQCITFYQQRVNHALGKLLEHPMPSPRLQEAMRYVSLDGGKRFRAALVYGAVEALEGDLYVADMAACAVELIHAYSLVHDDLPAMDNDDWRRGKPSCHKQFDEATAILTGDALQTLAFEILANQNSLSEIQRIQQIRCLAQASGAFGMVAGQMIDIHAVGSLLTEEELKQMHSLKTGALIKASTELGALCATTTSSKEFNCLSDYAKLVGLAFQVHDDVLDATSSPDILGKTAGSDALLNKPTFTSLMGVVKSQEYALFLIESALQKIAIFGENAANLRDIARYCVEREK